MPHSFRRQEEIDQIAILATWYRERREGLCYIDLPAVEPCAGLAAHWATAILDGQSLNVGREIPENQGEQHHKAGRQKIEDEGGAAVVGGMMLDLAG
jgi:hypothetical protein